MKREIRVWTTDGRYIWIQYHVGKHESKWLARVVYSFVFIVSMLGIWMLWVIAPGIAV